MYTTRLMKTGMVASTALFALLVAYNNIVDHGPNAEFVRHTLSMDTTFTDSAIRNRAITSPVLWSIAFWLIIAAEAATGLVLLAGSVRLATTLRGSAAEFNAAKRYAIMGAGLGFLLWFTGFLVVGGEWFAMWQSKLWNGQESAFRFYMTLLAVIIFVNQPDGEV